MEVPLERMQVSDRHKWLYSVVPTFPASYSGTNSEGGIYLAGFCPVCRNSFTVKLKADTGVGHVLMDQLDVPTTGCVPVT